jgi:MFS family permease
MILRRQARRIRAIYADYPRQFWVLMASSFIDHIGGALIYPFLTLYVTRKFNVGMTEVGLVFGLFAISSVVGSTIGGAMTDRLGRKGMLVFGLVGSASATLAMGLANSLGLFLLSTLFVGLLAHSGGPAQQAMVADLLPEHQRAQGFGMLRVIANLAVTIGPAIGGFVAARSYLLLFICDVAASLAAAIFVVLTIRETRPAGERDGEGETMLQTFKGYGDVLRDAAFVLFMLACVLRAFVGMQLTTTLPVYLRDTGGVSERGFGTILSLNAAMVVLFQFPITRWTSRRAPLAVMAGGMVMYSIGYAMYGFVSAYAFFLVAMAVLTVGEMMTAPVSQSLVSRMAPERMRGRYMATYGFSWVIPAAAGPTLAGLVMDYADPRWVWYGTGLVGLLAASVFLLLRRRMSRRIGSDQATAAGAGIGPEEAPDLV